MKRIGLFLGVEPHAGGMFQYAQSLLEALNALPKHGYEVVVACASPSWQATLGHYHFSVHYLRGARRGQFFAYVCMALRLPGFLARTLNWAVNPLVHQLRHIKCDYWIFPAQDALAYQCAGQHVVSIHDLMHRYEPHFPEVSSRRRYAIREHRFRNLTQRARAILVDSEVGKQHVIESYGAAPERVFPLPYIPPSYVLNYKEAADFDLRHALPPKFFFYPAQFWHHKNHKRLISAAALLRDTHPDIQLVFTGSPRHAYEEIRAYVEALGMLQHVTFHGHVAEADLPGFYHRARALIMPTFFGPTNIPPLEAMACNCPVAISGTYGMPEQCGAAALYFDPSSVEDMAGVMRRLWEDDHVCEQLKTEGKRKLANWGQLQFNQRLQTILSTL